MNPRWPLNKFSALGLSVALLATQSLFAYQPEKSFWAQRRQAARRTHAPVLTSFPLGRSGEGSLAAQFPSPQLLRSSLSQTVARSVPKSFVKDHAQLLASLSPAHGTVRKVSLGLNPAPAGPVVVHIQDVHMNAEAQGNIRETLAGLLNSGQVGLMALEGSTKDIVLQPFVDFPNRKAVESTANYLLKENKISGPIHAAMTAQRQLPRILGIDDPVHYAANVQAYKDSAPKLEETRLRVIEQQKELDEQKKAVFSPALLTLDQTVTDYRNDKVSLGNYVLALQDAVHSLKISSDFKVVGLFLNALKIEHTLNFKQVEVEREQLIDRLTSSLNNQEIKSLMAQSVAYRTGELRYGDFYAQLKETCQKKGIRISDFPAMDEYIRYILLVDGIDADQLLNEIASLEKSAYGQLAKSLEEKALVARSRHLWLTARLVDFSLIPQEWQEYKAAGGKDTYLAPFESFYQEAETRDTAMAQNLLSALNDKHSKTGSVTTPIAVLVTGGFHADGIARQLTRQGITVLSYVPKIEKVNTTQGSAYLSVFTQEKTPLEKLFQGEKLFLSPDTVTATKTLAPPLVVGMDTLTGERNESLIEKEEALLSFLKETTGEDVQVKVSKIGENLDDGSVNVAIRLGEKETQIKIKTGPQFEILAVDGFSPAPPSSIAHWLMRGFARLHTWLGPAAHRVVKFTETIPLSGLPFWSAANKAWWLTFHPTIKSVSDVVWQLAFIEGAATTMRRFGARSWIQPFSALLYQIRFHGEFNETSPIHATSFASSDNDHPAGAEPAELTRKIETLEKILNSRMGNIDKDGIAMIEPLSQELVQNGSVAQLERLGVLLAPRSFNFNREMAEMVQKSIPLILNALNGKKTIKKTSAQSKIIDQISKNQINRWEEILWTLELLNELPLSAGEPLLVGIISNVELRKIKSDTTMGKRMEHVAEGLHWQVGCLLARIDPTSPLFQKVRILIKLLPRESDLYNAWSLAAHIDDVLLDSKFSHKLRERIHGHFSNEDYDLTVAYRHYMETGSLDKIRAIDPFFIPDERDEFVMTQFQKGADANVQQIYDSFVEMEKYLRLIIHHEPSGFENRYHLLESHREMTEKLIGEFTHALSTGRASEVVHLGGQLRNVLRGEMWASKDPATRVQFLLLDEDVERMVYLYLGNYLNSVRDHPVDHIQDVALIFGDLAEQMAAYGLISLNTEDMCSLIRNDQAHLSISQVRDIARMLIDNHNQLGYVFLNQYHTIGMAISNNASMKVDQFIGALMRRRELDLHRAVQLAEVFLKGADSFLAEDEDRLLFPTTDETNGLVEPFYFYPGLPPPLIASLRKKRSLYGSKGSNLAILGSEGVNVPEGFILPSTLGRLRRELGPGVFNAWLEKEIRGWVKKLEKSVGEKDRFGVTTRPLLLSVRSGSAISMPGMMSTIPNIGVNDAVTEGLAKKTKNPWFAYDTYRLFLRDFAVATWGIDAEIFNDVIPLVKIKEGVSSKTMLSLKGMKSVLDQYKEIIARHGHKKELNAILSDPYLALVISINTVIDSWESGPARIYRDREGISHDWGTAIIVQRMRFGNLLGSEDKPSMTGVLFTRDVHNAQLGLNGEYVISSQGNDIVAGVSGHAAIHNIPGDMRNQFPEQLKTLEQYAFTADRKFRANQDIEFTSEKGLLYVLQSRDKTYEGDRSRQLDSLGHRATAMGVGVSGGGFRGVVAFIDSDLSTLQNLVDSTNGTLGKNKIDGVIMLVNAPGNNEVNKMLEVKGWAVGAGGRTSHAALMAKQHGVHAIFGLTFSIDHSNRWAIIKSIDGEKVVREGDIISIDGSTHAGGLFRGALPFKRDDVRHEGPGGGVWPWMRDLFGYLGVSGSVYDRWFAWIVENALSHFWIGPLFSGGAALFFFWTGVPSIDLSDHQFAWVGFLLAHFAQIVWGKSPPTQRSIYSATILSVVGIFFDINPLSVVGLISHFGLNYVRESPEFFNALLTWKNKIFQKSSHSVGHAVKIIRSDLKVRAMAREDALKAVSILRHGNVMRLDDLRALLLPKTETPAVEQVSPGLAFSHQTAQRLRDDFEYRHEFIQAYRKELTKADMPLPSFGDVFWSLHQASTVGPTTPPAAKENNTIQVIEEIISDRDLDKARALIDRVIRENGSGSAGPFKLRLISADPSVRENLERMAQGNPHIFVRSVELDAARLAEDFDRWRTESRLQKIPLRLVIGVSEGVVVAGTAAGNSLYSIALRVALSGIPVRPIDIENMLQIAEAVAENA